MFIVCISYLSCQLFMIVLFVSYCLKPSMLISTEYETVIRNEKYSKIIDFLKIIDGNKNEKKAWIEAILAYILSIITISHFCRTIPFRNIILKNTSFISNLNSKHLKITLNYAFSIRPFKGTLPITSKSIISILSVVMSSWRLIITINLWNLKTQFMILHFTFRMFYCQLNQFILCPKFCTFLDMCCYFSL